MIWAIIWILIGLLVAYAVVTSLDASSRKKKIRISTIIITTIFWPIAICYIAWTLYKIQPTK